MKKKKDILMAGNSKSIFQFKAQMQRVQKFKGLKNLHEQWFGWPLIG